MKKHDELIFWYDQPPKVSIGAFNSVSKKWGNKVFYICDHNLGDHRKMINWDDTDYGDAQLIILSELENEEEFIQSIFEKYPDAVHVQNGFVSVIAKKIRRYIKKPGIKLLVTTEKTLVTRWDFNLKKFVMNRLLPIKYKFISKKYKKYVSAVTPLGVRGKELFESYGWEPEKVFSYMYCPVLRDVGKLPDILVSEPIRFLYVGRLKYATRGVDTMIKALEMLDDENWELDLVGGYGDDKDEIIAWANAHPKVNYMGVWPADEVGVRMKNYDVYLVPTKMDGWNSQINEALNAGVGVITTDEAVSEELIKASGAGAIVRCADAKQFSEAIKDAIHNPDKVMDWKEKARAYRNRINHELVGDYFIEILEYVFYEKEDRPVCPWL